jgi:hypothetical protein
MKKLFIFSLLFISCEAILAQQKPRRFTKPTAICPINYSSLSTIGITNANQLTVNIITTNKTLSVGERLPANAVSKDNANSIEITDTTFKYTLLSEEGLVFKVIQEIGSFTVIKLWSYGKKPNDSQKSEYENFSNRASLVASPIAKKIDGIKKVTNSEVLLFAAGAKITASDYIDPTKDFYLVKTADINSKSEEFDYVKGAWNVGLMYLPIKLRPFARRSGAFDFTSNINLGVSFSSALTQNLKSDFTSNLLLYIGASSIKVDSLIAGDTSYKQTAQETLAFSPAIGMYWQKKSIQLGFAIGMDFLIGKLQKTWDYRGMPWISLTAGINIFNLTKNTNSAKGTN